MFRFRLMVRLIVCLAIISGDASGQNAARSPNADPTTAVMLREALRQVEAGDADAAIKTLDGIITQDDEVDLMQWTARLLKNQLTGAFKARQAYWLKRRVVDMLVLVPDDAAFAEATAGWTDEQFYPVLIADAWYAPMFARVFRPKRLVMWTGEGKGKFDIESIASAHNAAVANRQSPHRPPGLVVIRPGSERSLAGLALARGRGQPIHLQPAIDMNPDVQALGQFNAAIMTEAMRWRLARPDQWFGLTLTGEYPYTYDQADRKHGPHAVDDLLGRESRGLRMAVIGRLVGDRTQTVYQAMCSLFLQPDRMLMFDDYSNRKSPGFAPYRLTEAARILGDDYPVTLVENADVTPGRFRRLTRHGEPFDMFWINSSGAPQHWILRGRATVDDLPLDHPAIYHFVHSFAAQYHWNTNTLAGRALAGGGYWFFGAEHEPYVHAFATPTGMAMKVAAGTPLAFAARQMPGHPLYRPWKLVVLGDPLLSLRDEPARRLEPITMDNTTPLTLDEATDPGGRLLAAALGSPNEALKPAVECLRHAEDVTPDALARAVKVVYDHGGARAVAALDAETAKRHPIAEAMVWRCAAEQVDRRLDAGDMDAARDDLHTMLRLGTERAPLERSIERFVDVAARHDRRTEAERWLREQARGDLPKTSQRAIDSALAPAQG